MATAMEVKYSADTAQPGINTLLREGFFAGQVSQMDVAAITAAILFAGEHADDEDLIRECGTKGAAAIWQMRQDLLGAK